ncbi:hypothetical protein [Cellulomonas sp. NPDC089187]|uniref:hypothetical protein n=1 Tax=Cellulomonas sp. NPDC089187 TaxID=3154970 RepID=UPI00341AADBF
MRSAIFAAAAELWRECRQDYAEYLDALLDDAERTCRGHLVNARGQAKGITAESLLLGPMVRVRAYGTPELLEFLAGAGRMTQGEHERHWFAAHDDRLTP